MRPHGIAFTILYLPFCMRSTSQLDAGSKPFLFSSPEGRQLVRDILKDKLPYQPHDYQIEGVCKSLDGVSLISIIPTGGGKTGFFLMYMLVLQSLSTNLELCPAVNVPKDPSMIIAYHTQQLD